MLHGYKRIKNDIWYFRKDHYCPDCGTKLQKVAVSKVVNSSSPEAKDFDFSNVDTYMVGNVKFTWDEFECPSCQKHLTVSEMKKIEGIPLPQKSGKLGVVLFLVFGILLLIVIHLIGKH